MLPRDCVEIMQSDGVAGGFNFKYQLHVYLGETAFSELYRLLILSSLRPPTFDADVAQLTLHNLTVIFTFKGNPAT